MKLPALEPRKKLIDRILDMVRTSVMGLTDRIDFHMLLARLLICGDGIAEAALPPWADHIAEKT